MQSSKSHVSLKDLPTIFDNVHLDNRTATSTPSARHKTGSSVSRHAMLTPPADTLASDPMLHHRLTKSDNNSRTSILLESKSEDDVFGGGNGVKLPAISDASTVAQKSNTATPLKPEICQNAENDPITPENVQGRMPNEHSVFVANLVKDLSDDQLRLAVQDVFKQFGSCVVKIARDRHHKHPFAIVNYWTDAEAKLAIKQGRGLLIHDRSIRTEAMQAQRTLVLCRDGGGSISKEEAEKLLSAYGEIVEVKQTTHEDAAEKGLPEGAKVTFKYYPCFQAALKFRGSESAPYSVVNPQDCQPPPKRSQREVTFGHGSANRTSKKGDDNTDLARSMTDQKSIFLGNLPNDVCEEELKELFAGYGTIKGCDVVRKTLVGGRGGVNVFGFIEYETSEQAKTASKYEKYVRGHKIRVEPKEYSVRRSIRAQDHSVGRFAMPRGPRRDNFYMPPEGYLPYGYYHPMYMPAPPPPAYAAQGPSMPNGLPPFTYAATPPNSAFRGRGGNNWYQENAYFVGHSPQSQYGQGFGREASAGNGNE